MFTKVFTISALAAVVSAQSAVLGFTNVPNPVTDGQAQAITYQTNDTVTPVTITLRQGVSNALTTVYNLTTSANGGAFIWTPATDLPNGADYALQISQGTQVNYFGPFRVQGYQGPSTSSSSAASNSSSISTTTPISTGSAVPIGTAPASLSAGTGSAPLRNTTFSSATLTASSTALTSAPASNSAGATTSSGTSRPTSSTSATPTGAAVANFQVGSSLALVGAIAAMLLP